MVDIRNINHACLLLKINNFPEQCLLLGTDRENSFQTSIYIIQMPNKFVNVTIQRNFCLCFSQDGHSNLLVTVMCVVDRNFVQVIYLTKELVQFVTCKLINNGELIEYIGYLFFFPLSYYSTDNVTCQHSIQLHVNNENLIYFKVLPYSRNAYNCFNLMRRSNLINEKTASRSYETAFVCSYFFLN